MHQLSFSMPAKACDSHLHIIDPSFPNDGKAASQTGTLEQYRMLAQKLKLERAIFVQPKPFGTDNACLLDAIQSFGIENSRGIAVVSPDITDSELDEMDKGGVRGLRFSVWNPDNAVVSIDSCPALAARISNWGWNIQLHCSSNQIMEFSNMLSALPSKLVIDHMGRMDPKLGKGDPAFKTVCKLIDRGMTWVKLSGPYLNTAEGIPWNDAAELAMAFVEYAPERVVWGSDFPHVTEKVKPDIYALAELIPVWFADEHRRKLALVSNPAELYGF